MLLCERPVSAALSHAALPSSVTSTFHPLFGGVFAHEMEFCRRELERERHARLCILSGYIVRLFLECRCDCGDADKHSVLGECPTCCSW